MILDHAEDPKITKWFWPFCGNGAVIVTTQNWQISAIRNANGCFIELEAMGPEDGSKVIQAFLRSSEHKHESKASEWSDFDLAKQVSHAVGGYPLALAHLAAYIRESQISLSECFEALNQRSESRRIWHRDVYVDQYEKTLQTVNDAALSRLEKDERKYLDVLAFLNSNSIPEELFESSTLERSTFPLVHLTKRSRGE